MVHGWSIKNVEGTRLPLKIGRSEIEDDRYGVYGPMFKQMGVDAKTHPDTLIFPLLNAGFASPCYDGQTFFSAAHPVGTAGGGYNAGVASNMQAGTGPAWFLLCTNQAMRPVIWQKRIPYEFQSLVSPTDANVFFRDEYFYGVRARVNAGYGLWQLAFGSQAPLSADNYAAARTAMMIAARRSRRHSGHHTEPLGRPAFARGECADPAEGDDGRGDYGRHRARHGGHGRGGACRSGDERLARKRRPHRDAVPRLRAWGARGP